MSKFKSAVMAKQYDDMGGVIPELELIDSILDGIDLPEVNMPEGYGGECLE